MVKGARLRLSLPGLTRQSIHLRKNSFTKNMDAQVKPAHDDSVFGNLSGCRINSGWSRRAARATEGQIATRKGDGGCEHGKNLHPTPPERINGLEGATRKLSSNPHLITPHLRLTL
jgi:hypothetical protein